VILRVTLTVSSHLVFLNEFASHLFIEIRRNDHFSAVHNRFHVHDQSTDPVKGREPHWYYLNHVYAGILNANQHAVIRKFDAFRQTSGAWWMQDAECLFDVIEFKIPKVLHLNVTVATQYLGEWNCAGMIAIHYHHRTVVLVFHHLENHVYGFLRAENYLRCCQLQHVMRRIYDKRRGIQWIFKLIILINRTWNRANLLFPPFFFTYNYRFSSNNYVPSMLTCLQNLRICARIYTIKFLEIQFRYVTLHPMDIDYTF